MLVRNRLDAGAAIVTDSALRTALYTIRSLGRRGVRVTAVERPMPKRENLGALSRYVHRRVTLPSSITEPEAFTAALLDLAADHDAVLPIGMQSIECVSRNHDRFAARLGRSVPLAPWATIERADRTRALLTFAEGLGIPVPQRYRPEDYGGVEACAAALTYPVIVKTGLEGELPPAGRYGIARDASEFVRLHRRLSAHVTDPIVQELIEGDGIGFEALYDFDGVAVATFCHRRLGWFPLSGGPSTYCESIRHPRAEELGRRLLDGLGWVGLAMVEFKIDRRSGEPKLMEINPRPWGSMALPIAAGTDFPWLWYLLARDGRVTPTPPGRPGVRLRFAVQDLQAALAEWRSHHSIPRSLRRAASFLDPRVHEGVLSLGDPRPTVAYLAKALRRASRGGGQ